MGGRKSYYIKNVVNPNKNSEQARLKLNKSIKTGNPEEVARESAILSTEHRDIAKILFYSKKLYSVIKEKYSRDDIRVLKELNKKVRNDWTNIKETEKIESNSIINAAVIDIVSRVLKERA